MENKKVKEILYRLLSEECQKLNKISERISLLNHQAENYEQMHEIYKEKVVEDMLSLMNENGWDNWIKELQKEEVSQNKE